MTTQEEWRCGRCKLEPNLHSIPDSPAFDCVYEPELVPTQEELSQGHLFTISVTGRGVHKVAGDPSYYEDGWESEPLVVSVRAFSLAAALRKALDLPFETWFVELEKKLNEEKGK